MAAMQWALVLAGLAAADAFAPALVPGGAPRLRRPRADLSMRVGPQQKLLIEVPSNANVHVVAAVKEVIEEDVSVAATSATKGPGITFNTAGMGQAPYWVAFIGGLTIFKMIRQKAAGRGIMDNKDAKYIPQSEAELGELKVFACGNCGYEMMPAKGREGKFFPKNFKCPICGADKDQFWDMNDPNDPRNKEEEKQPKAKTKAQAKPAAGADSKDEPNAKPDSPTKSDDK